MHKVYKIFYALIVATANLAYASEEHVLELSDATFSSELSRYDTTLVMFYAPW